jgi:phosphoglycerol transferase
LVKKLRLEHAWIATPFLLALWSISRVWNVLPSIMQDEYIYASQAKNLPFEEQNFSNYIFSWVMSLTNNCGTEFYSCTKSINSVLFLGTVAITFLIATRFLSFRTSVFVASVAALSPVAVPVSYFMPETMYFFMMNLTIWITLVVSKRNHWLSWAASGLLLGMTALVKPHALFLLPAFAVFAFLYTFKRNESGLLQAIRASATVVTTFLVAKFSLGYAFAGTAGLKLFGGYESPAAALTAAISQPAPQTVESSPSPDAVPAPDLVAASEAASGLELFLGVSVSHLLAHTAVLMLLAGIPLILSIRVTASVIRTKQPIGDVSAFFILIGLVTASMIGLVSLFEGYVTAGGDDHTDRLILRYYEFLIPAFLVMWLLLGRFTDSIRRYRIIQGSVVVLATMIFVIYYPIIFNKQFADSSTLPGLGNEQGLFIFVGLFISSAVVYWIVNPQKGNQVLGRFIVPLVLVLALVMSQNKLIEINGSTAYFDRAGWDSRSYLENVPGERILVIGQTRTEVFTVKFWIDEANIRDLLVVQGTAITEQNVADADFVVALGGMTIDFDHKVLTSGEGYQLVEVVR